jgi:hypothetical protein
MPVYSPAVSMTVTVSPLIDRLAIFGVAALPFGARNCPCQRSRFASTLPPCPGPKKYTPHSPVAVSPAAGAIV